MTRNPYRSCCVPARVSDRDIAGKTALHWSAAFGIAGITAMLLDHGAAVNAKDAHGNTPLLWAVRVWALVNNGGGPERRAGDAEDETQQYAYAETSVRYQKYMAAHHTGFVGNAPAAKIAAEASSDYADVVRVLLKHGADPQVRNLDDKAAPDYASGVRNKGIIQLLSPVRSGKTSARQPAVYDRPSPSCQALLPPVAAGPTVVRTLKLGFERPGAQVQVVLDGRLPSLQITRDGVSTPLRDLSDLAGCVQIDNAADALAMVRLRSSILTYRFWQTTRRELEPMPPAEMIALRLNGMPDVLLGAWPHAPPYSRKDLVALAWIVDLRTGVAGRCDPSHGYRILAVLDLKAPPTTSDAMLRRSFDESGSGFFGIVPSRAFESLHLRIPRVTAAQDGFVIERWLLTFAATTPIHAVQLEKIVERVTRDGHYSRTVVSSVPAPEPAGVLWNAF